MWKIILIVVLVIACAFLGYLWYSCSSNIDKHKKDKEDKLNKRESDLNNQEKNLDSHRMCKEKLEVLLNNEKKIMSIIQNNLDEYGLSNSNKTVQL